MFARSLGKVQRSTRTGRRVVEGRLRPGIGYPLVRPAAEAAGYGCKARLCGLDRAMPGYVLKNHY